MNTLMNLIRKVVLFLLVFALIALCGYFAYQYLYPRKAPPPPSIQPVSFEEPEIPSHSAPKLHLPGYEVGGFGPDQERKDYRSGTMKLIIPRLNYNGPVLSLDLNELYKQWEESHESDESLQYKLAEDMNLLLNEGVVLFNQAQLPGPENRNVTIAGHRDFMGMEFYYIDTLVSGDRLYLEYQKKLYIYEYRETLITEENDWSPVAVQEKSVLTLQSCDPIYAPGGNYDRIFVVAELVDIYNLEEESYDLSSYGPVMEAPATDQSGASSTTESTVASLLESSTEETAEASAPSNQPAFTLPAPTA